MYEMKGERTMKKIGIGSRVLALLLVLAMVLPMVPSTVFAASVGDIATDDEVGDTGLVADIDTQDTISWPIKIYDYLNDGMLFEYSNAAYSGDISDSKGGAYGGGVAPPLMNSEAAGAVIGNDYTIGSTFDEFAYTYLTSTSAYTNMLDDSVEGPNEAEYSEVEAVNFQDPGYLRAVYYDANDTNDNATKSHVWISNFARDNNCYYTGNQLRYAVIVYRTNAGYEAGTAKFYMAVSDGYYGSSSDSKSDYYHHVTLLGRYGIDISDVSTKEGYGTLDGASFTVPKSTEWRYLVVDMKSGNLATYWNNFATSSKVAGIGFCFPVNQDEETMEISHVAYFDTQFEATEFGKDAVAFDKNPGEYLNSHTEYTTEGNPHPGSVSGNGWDLSSASSSAWDSSTIARWSDTSDSYGGMTVTQKQDASVTYLNVTNTDSSMDSTYIWVSSNPATANDYGSYPDIKYVTLVYRTHNISNPKLGFWLEDGETGAWDSGKTEDTYVSIMASSDTWVYYTYDLTALDDIESFSGRVDYFNRIGIKFPGFTSSSQSMDLAFVDYFDNKTAADSFGAAAAAYMNNPGGSYTTTQKKWNTGNNVAYSFLYANQGGGWYVDDTDGDGDVDYNDSSVSGGENAEPNGYYSYQIGKTPWTGTSATVTNNDRATAKANGYTVSDNIYLLNSWQMNDSTLGYYDMSQLDVGYTLLNKLYSGVMTMGLLEHSLTTVSYTAQAKNEDGELAYTGSVTENEKTHNVTVYQRADGSYYYVKTVNSVSTEVTYTNTDELEALMTDYEYRVPDYKEETVEYLAYLLRSSLCIGKTDSSGNYNYNFVSGTANGEQYGYDSTGKAYDLSSALRARLGIVLPANGNCTSGYAAVGDYATMTDAQKASLIGAYLDVEDNITTFVDAAYYLLMNLYVGNSYNQEQDEYNYLVMSKATVSTNGKEAYVFDGGFTTGIKADTANTDAYRESSESAVVYDKTNGTISLSSAASKDKVYFQSSSTTSRFPFLPVTDSEGVYAGETKSPYFLDDGNGVMGVTEEGATFVNRNYNYAMVTNGEFVYHEEDGLFFDFEGDDDVYLFINGELVVDVGAAHSVTTVTMNVDDYVAWAKGVLADLTGYTAGMSDAKFAKCLTDNGITDEAKIVYYTRAHRLNLVDGASYSFDFYYMERHGWGANCRIATNIVVTDPTQRTTKQAYQNDEDGTLKEIAFGGLVDDTAPIMYKFAMTNEGNTKLYKMSFKDNSIGLDLTWDQGLVTYGTPSIGKFTTTAASTPLIITGLNGAVNVDGHAYYVSEDGTFSWQESEEVDGETVTTDKTATQLNLDAGDHVLTLYQVNSSVLFTDAIAKINIGGVESATHNNYTPEAGTDGTYTLQLNKINKLTIDGIRVANANGNALSASDLIITVDGFSSEENYNLYQSTQDSQYKLDTFTVKVSTNEQLKAFLTLLTDPAGQTEQDGDVIEDAATEKAGVFAGSGLWRHATVTITGFWYTMSPQEQTDNVFNNTVYTTAYGTLKSTEPKKGQASHRVYAPGAPAYYQWAGHNLLITHEKLYDDAQEASAIAGNQLSEYKSFFDNVGTQTVSYLLVDENRQEYDYDYVNLTDAKTGYMVNYPTAGNETFYVLMYIGDDPDTTEENKFALVPVTVYVTDVKDSVYVLDYGLKTEDLNSGGELFKNDSLHGEDGSDVAKLMGVTATQPSYLDPVTNSEKYNYITFSPLSMTRGGIVEVKGADDAQDGYFSLDLAIPATGKTISYNAYSRCYSLSDAGTVKLHAIVPSTTDWENAYVYFWYDNGTSNGWPGTKMVRDSYGQFSLDIPGDISNVIINNGNGIQTVDLSLNPGYESWVTLGELENGKYLATVSTAVASVVIHAKVPESWTTPMLHYWGSTESSNWPGAAMTAEGDDGWYSLEIPGTVTGVVVNNGTSDSTQTHQTIDQPLIPGKEAWITIEDSCNPNYTWTNNGHTTYKYDAVTTYSQETFTVDVKVPSGWGTPSLYYWYSNGSVTGVDWPGVQMSGPDDDGWYSLDIPVGVTKIIVTDGANKQTVNIDIEEAAAETDTWVTVTSTTNYEGKYLANVAESSISFTPTDFMDTKYNIWLGVTVHEVGYTPTVLGSDTGIDINSEVQMYKKVTVLPATVVYYEDDFPAIHYAAEPSTDGTASGANTFKRIGSSSDKTQGVDQNENFGYDDTYAADSNKEYSGGSLTSIKIGDNQPAAYFTFTGTGFELISRTNAVDSATIKVKVYNASDVTNGVPNSGASYVKYASVITEFDQGADGGTDAIYQVPVIRIDGLTKGSYTVIITGVPAYTYDEDGTKTGTRDTYLYVDGLRIMQPLGASDSDYNARENNASFVELRDEIQEGNMGFATSATISDGSFTVSTGTVTWTENRVGTTHDGKEYSGNSVSSVNDYLALGPNNEVYMDSTTNSALVFYVKHTDDTSDTADLQIAISAIDRGLFYGGASTAPNAVIQMGVYKDNAYAWETIATITTSTEMYYSIPFADCPYTTNGYQVVLRVVDASGASEAALASFASLKYNGLTITDMGAESATIRYGEKGMEELAEDGLWYGVEYTNPEDGSTIRWNPNVSSWQKYDKANDTWTNVELSTAQEQTLESTAAYPAFEALSAQMSAGEDTDFGETDSGSSENGLFDISYASMTMGNSLAINFAFAQDQADDWTGYYAQIVKTYADGRDDVTETVALDAWKSTTINDEAYYYVTFNGIAAKEMSDEVRVTICNANGEAVSNTWIDSIRDQSMRALEKAAVTDLEKTMIVDMLNYGAAAQEYFGYNTADLANNQLTAEQKALASEAKGCTNGRTSSGSYAASTVVLKSNIQLMFAFADVNETMYAEVTYTNHRGIEKTITIDGASFGSNNGYSIVTVDALVVADARQDVTCRVYDASGDLVASVTDSVASYTARNTDSELFVLMMKYSDSAYAYFHS